MCLKCKLSPNGKLLIVPIHKGQIRIDNSNSNILGNGAKECRILYGLIEFKMKS